MWIQCFITKFDGSDVFVDFEAVRYIFSRNAVGDAVCFVGNGAHVRRLLKMGPGAYDEYVPPEGLQDGQPGAAPGGSPVPLGKHQEQRRDPEAREPLPDALSVDEALTQGGQQETAPPITTEMKAEVKTSPPANEQEKAQDSLNETAAEGVAKAAAAEAADKQAAEEVQWHPEAIETKINEFKFLDKANFKSFVEAHSDQVMGWPVPVRAAIAKKLNKKLPDFKPGIEGFVINDYLGNDTGNS